MHSTGNVMFHRDTVHTCIYMYMYSTCTLSFTVLFLSIPICNIFRAQEKNGKGTITSSLGEGDEDGAIVDNSSDKETQEKLIDTHTEDGGSGSGGESQLVGREGGGSPMEKDESLNTSSINVTHTNNDSKKPTNIRISQPTSKPLTQSTTTTTTTVTTSSSSSSQTNEYPAVTSSVTLMGMTTSTSTPRKNKKEEGWKEVGKR